MLKDKRQLMSPKRTTRDEKSIEQKSEEEALKIEYDTLQEKHERLQK
jgi:hypothetical protein